MANVLLTPLWLRRESYIYFFRRTGVLTPAIQEMVTSATHAQMDDWDKSMSAAWSFDEDNDGAMAKKHAMMDTRKSGKRR